MKELDFNELNKIAGGIDQMCLPQNGMYQVEIREDGGRKIMYVYDQDGNFILAQDITEETVAKKPNPEAYQDFLKPRADIDISDILK